MTIILNDSEYCSEGQELEFHWGRDKIVFKITKVYPGDIVEAELTTIYADYHTNYKYDGKENR